MKIKFKGLKIDEEGYINTDIAPDHKYHYKLNKTGKGYILTDIFGDGQEIDNCENFAPRNILYFLERYKDLNK